MKAIYPYLANLAIVLLLLSCGRDEPSIHRNELSPQVDFAEEHIRIALSSWSGIPEPPSVFRFQLEDDGQADGSYEIELRGSKVRIRSGDVNGLMYGGLEVAEQILLHGAVENTIHSPYIQKRGIKMNIPLDARTPSYDDTGDAAQANVEHMWSMEFWEEYLDRLALYRFNVLTLWNPHPFPSMIRQENFPDVALDDVYVTTLKPTGKESEWAEPQMVSSNVVENMQVVKTIGINEKIAFWQDVMQYAHDRGIEIYFFTWNMCPNGAAKPVPPFYRTYGIELWEEEAGKHGISNQMDNPVTAAYYRDAVKTFLLTYPHVKGIGVTAGEHMMDSAGAYTREQWIWESYGLGILDAKKEQPGREVDFIHRVWNTNMDKIMHYWEDYPGSFEASFKYARARLYSTPEPDFAEEHIRKMEEYGLSSWWNLRNDDIFVHRWGDPDYVRDFIHHFDREHTAGFYMGSDGYVWGREFTSRKEALSGELEIDKHWYRFMLWGRLAFNPSLDSSYFVSRLHNRYPACDAPQLYSGWKASSEIIPLVNRFHWNDWDYQWAVEACIDVRNGFHTVERFISNRTLEGSGLINPQDFARASSQGIKLEGVSPFEVAEKLESLAEEALSAVQILRPTEAHLELNALLDDMESMAFLGLYYARKIEAATELALFMEKGEEEFREKAVSLLGEAAEYWGSYADILKRNYRPQMLARTGMFDADLILTQVKKDIEIARNK